MNLKEKYKDGKDILYYKNGQIQFEENSKGGKWNGKWTTYYENGQIMTEGIYKDGNNYFINGWNEDGELLVKDGNGTMTYYYESGKVKVEGNLKDGKEDGKHTYYYDNGQIKEEGNFKDEEKDGKWTTYHRNGQIEEKRNYFNTRLTFKVKELQPLLSDHYFNNHKELNKKRYIKIKNNLINTGWDSKLGFNFLLEVSIDSNGIPKKVNIANGSHRLAIMKEYGLNYNISTRLNLLFSDGCKGKCSHNKHLSKNWMERYPSKKELLDLIEKHVGKS